jgi:hypothetical protein
MVRPVISYGVDFAEGHLAVVKAIRGRKGIQHSVLLDEDAEMLPAGLRAEIADADGKDRAIVTASLPTYETVTRWLQTPLATMSKARKVLPSLLDIQLPFPLESCVYHVVDFRRDADHCIDALAVAARIQDATTRLGLFQGAGFDPERLDHEALALWAQSVREMPIERNSVRLVAYLGHDRVSLVLGRGSHLQAAHGLRAGMRDLFPDGVNANVDVLRPFAARVQQFLRSQALEKGSETLQWVWTGVGAAREDRLTVLQPALSGPFEVRTHTHQAPSSFLARALSVQGVEKGPLTCNFRSGVLAHPAAARRHAAQQRSTAVAVLAAGALLCAANGAWRVVLARRQSATQEAVAALAANLTRMSRIPRGQEVLVARRSMEEQAASTRPFLDAFEPSLTVLLSDLLGSAREKRIWIEALSLRHDGVELRGTAEDWNAGEGLADSLRHRGFTTQVDREDAGADERVHFAIKAERHPARRASP